MCHNGNGFLHVQLFPFFLQSVKSVQTSLLKCFSGFASRERQTAIAVDPPLISFIPGQFLIVLVLKFSKITFPQICFQMLFYAWKQDLCGFPAAQHRTTIKQIWNRISMLLPYLSQKTPSRVAQWFVCGSYVAFFLVAKCLSMPDQINRHAHCSPLIYTGLPASTRITDLDSCAARQQIRPVFSLQSRSKRSSGTMPYPISLEIRIISGF